MTLRNVFFMKAYNYLIFISLISILLYTRFVGLDWGLPYPMHPDERNMAAAIQQLSCEDSSFQNCLNPHFYAYGQFPLYLAYFLVKIYHIALSAINSPVGFEEATMALRYISAMSSVFTVFILWKTLKLITNYELRITKNVQNDKKHNDWFTFVIRYSSFLIFTFSPVLIQFAHFGTTESLLMVFYSLVAYLSLLFLNKNISTRAFVVYAGIACGVALGTKVSAAVFVVIPFVILCWYYFTSDVNRKLLHICFFSTKFALITAVFFLVTSPYNFISMEEFLGSMKYESEVGFGKYIPFYTKQFVNSVPVIFQAKYIFPYVLGMPIFILFLLGFILLPWKNKFINVLRIAFLIAFIPNALVFAKWTRFIAPAYPIMIVIAAIFLVKSYELGVASLRNKKNFRIGFNVLCFMFYVSCLLPGIAYLSIYRNTDVRFTASQWVMKNVPANSFILSETANVIDVPVPSPGENLTEFYKKTFKYVSFNSYDLDTNPVLQSELKIHLQKADYILVPSRRVFANHTCWREVKSEKLSAFVLNSQNYGETRKVKSDSAYFYSSARSVRLPLFSNKNLETHCDYLEKIYPELNEYYDKLFSGELGFEQVAEFSEYPHISLFGEKIYELKDENAEETWTVFDHPVIRVYKRVK